MDGALTLVPYTCVKDKHFDNGRCIPGYKIKIRLEKWTAQWVALDMR